MLTKYFEAKIGQAIHRKAVGGNKNSFGPPYAKVYHAEILNVADDKILVNVTVHGVCPNGARDGGFDGETCLGDHELSTELEGLEDFWADLIIRADRRYVITSFEA